MRDDGGKLNLLDHSVPVGIVIQSASGAVVDDPITCVAGRRADCEIGRVGDKKDIILNSADNVNAINPLYISGGIKDCEWINWGMYYTMVMTWGGGRGGSRRCTRTLVPVHAQSSSHLFQLFQGVVGGGGRGFERLIRDLGA
jgi:hypothetical protein